MAAGIDCHEMRQSGCGRLHPAMIVIHECIGLSLSCPRSSMKIGNHTPITPTINLELEVEPRAPDDHLKRKIQIIKLYSSRCRESCE